MKHKLLMLLLAGVTACDSAIEPAVRSSANQFPVRANWTATISPVGTSTVSGTLQVSEHLGSRVDATITLNAAANSAYQWRIYRGNCATNTAAASNTAPTGLLIFGTTSGSAHLTYSDVETNAGGTGSVTRTIAGALDSLTAYSVRVRPAQSATNWNGTNPVACGNLQRS